MKMPIIGLVPLVDIGRDSLWMLPGYMDGVREAGGLPVMLPLTDDDGELERLAGLIDGLLLTGGQDVSPRLYGEEPRPCCGETSPARDAMEAKLLKLILAQDKPVLGICRGIQFLNAYMGGTLWQDLPTERPTAVCHRQPAPYDRPIHSVSLVPASPLAELLGAEELRVNSCHHQGVKHVAPGLEPMAYAPDGLVEAVRKPDARFVWAVQWHPEFSHLVDESSRAIFREFVARSRA